MCWWKSEPAQPEANNMDTPSWTPDGQPMVNEPNQDVIDTSFADALNAEREARNAQAEAGEAPKKWWQL